MTAFARISTDRCNMKALSLLSIDNLAVTHDQFNIAVLGDFMLVRDNYNRVAIFSQGIEQFHDVFGCSGIKISSWLVREYQGRSSNQSPGDCDSLSLPAG